MSKKGKIKIVVVGGGSYLWGPLIVKDLLLMPSLADADIVLYDKNLEAATFCKKFLEKVAEALKIKSFITATDDCAQAFRKADYLIITIASGGLDAIGRDLEIPEEYGIFHTVGDTTGPGGWIRTIRNFGAFMDLSNAINKYAPGAIVLNYSNSMPALTDILTRTCSGHVLGLCSGIHENHDFLMKFYKLKNKNQMALKYGGLNHFFWITEAKTGDINILADLHEHLKTKSMSDLLDSCGASSAYNRRPIADELFRFTGFMPFLGDRHTCEYFPWFITNKQNLKTYNILRTSAADRREAGVSRLQMLKDMLKNGIGAEFLERGHETVSDIIDAHSQGKIFVDIGNMPNAGQISNLPKGCIVETAIKTDRNGFTPVNFGALPEPIVGFCLPFARVHKMIVDSCFNRDRNMALQALRLDPVCSHLNTKQVLELAEKLLAANKQYINIF